MKKTTLITIIIAVVVIAVGGFVIANMNSDGDNDNPPTSSTQSQDTGSTSNTGDTSSQGSSQTPENNVTQQDEVEIEDSAFKPASITVKKGTTVKWTNKDDIQHNVAPDEQSDAFKGSPMLSKGDSYSFTFNTVGTYSYHCTPHPFMKGTVTVTE